MANGAATIFKGRDIVYTQVELECDEDGFTGVEKLLYIGTNYEASRNLVVDIQDVAELRHRTYVDNELIFESAMSYGDIQWVSTFDLLDKLEAESEAAKQKLAEVTRKLMALGQL